MRGQNSAFVTTGALADVGSQLTVQEDSWGYVNFPFAEKVGKLALDKGHLYVVADGVGGTEAGGLASGIAVQTIIDSFYRDRSTDIEESLKAAIVKADQRLFSESQERNLSMQTTVVCAVIRAEELIVAHAGDSRAYLMHSGQLRRLTTDHSQVQNLVEAKKLTEEEAWTHPDRRRITRSLGAGEQVKPDINSYQVHAGDYLLLCSDGLHGELRDEEIKNLILTNPDPQMACDTLVKQAKKAGGKDNISLIITRIEAVDRVASRLIDRILPLRVRQIEEFTYTSLASLDSDPESLAKTAWWQQPALWVAALITILLLVLVVFQSIRFQNVTGSLQRDLDRHQKIWVDTSQNFETLIIDYEEGKYGDLNPALLQQLERLNEQLQLDAGLVTPTTTPFVIATPNIPPATATPFN